MQKPIPTAKGIAQLFEASSPLTTPIIQRTYAWTEANVKEYWRDLAEAQDEDRYHFLGLIVVDQDGYIHDGQQRLATTFLLLQALKAQLDRCAASLSSQAAVDANVDGLAAALTRALQGEKQVPSPPLLIGTGDQSFLIDPATGISATTESAKRLVAARGVLAANLVADLDALPDDVTRVDALWRWWSFLTRQACVIELVVSSQTASSIFETLNTRGVHLLNADLVKSYLLATIEEGRQDEGMTIWRTITTTLVKETALNEFLLHYWGSLHGEITKSRLFDALKGYVDHRSAKAMRQLKSYERDSVLYAALRNANDPFWHPYGEAVVDSIRLINALGLTQLRYLLLAVLRDFPKGISEAKLRRKTQAKTLNWLGAWAMRAVVTRRTGGKPAERAYIEAATRIREGVATSVEDVKNVFVGAGRVANDAEFEASFSRASFNATATRLVLYAFETKLAGTDSPFGPKPKLTREHVLPQSPDWTKQDWAHFTHQAHSDYVERIGNILLLLGVTNRELKNKGWKEKKRIIQSKGVDQLPLTQEALKERHWTTASIDERQSAMAKIAVELWPE
jgi:Protein of unknown function DUF262/Protein of unknown function (DUF1524)